MTCWTPSSRMGRPSRRRTRSSGTRKKSRFRRPRRTGSSSFTSGCDTHELTSADALVAWESREEKSVGERWAKIEWEGVRGNSLIASFQYADTYVPPEPSRSTPTAFPGEGTSKPSRVTGESASRPGRSRQTYRRHTKGAVTWYKPNWFHGNHEFKAGFDYVDELGDFRALDAKPVNYICCSTTTASPSRCPSSTPRLFPRLASNYIGLYLKDSWTVGRRLTLNLGLRYAHDRRVCAGPAAARPRRLHRTSSSPPSASPRCSSRSGTPWPRACMRRTISRAMARP